MSRGWWSTPFPFQGVSGYDFCFLWLEGELEGVGSAHPSTLAIAFLRILNSRVHLDAPEPTFDENPRLPRPFGLSRTNF